MMWGYWPWPGDGEEFSLLIIEVLAGRGEGLLAAVGAGLLVELPLNNELEDFAAHQATSYNPHEFIV